MVIAGQDLLMMLNVKKVIEPFCYRTVEHGMSYGLSLAGYDIRIREDVHLGPQGFVLASTLEYFNMPLDVLCIVHDKSSWARRGIAVQNTVFEPGWRGFATLELSNHGKYPITIQGGSPIAQVIFHRLSCYTKGYEGKYQDQPSYPVPAIKEIPVEGYETFEV